MIHLLRKIRQRLLFKNLFIGSAGKYFVYAIGEIILVVIGILIALQINNANQRSKDRKEEARILNNLSRDLQNDSLQLVYLIERSYHKQAQMDTLFQALADPSSVSNQRFLNLSLSLVGDIKFAANSGTYDEAMASGIVKLIQNEPLREQIFDYYRYVGGFWEDDKSYDQSMQMIFPAFAAHVAPHREVLELFGHDGYFLSSIDPREMAQNKEFTGIVLMKYAAMFYQREGWQQVLGRTRELGKKIASETIR